MTSDLPQLMNGLALGESPIFRLPRELRDNISDLVALSEVRLNLRIGLKKGSKPQKTVFIAKGFNSVCSQLRQEYTKALERRVKMLMTTRRDIAGELLDPPGITLHAGVRARCQVSQTQHSDGTISQNVHAFTLPIGFESSITMPKAHPGSQKQPCFVISWAVDGNEVLETPKRLSAILDRDLSSMKFTFDQPEPAAAALKQLFKAVKEANWKGSVDDYVFWHDYVVRYVPRKLKG